MAIIERHIQTLHTSDIDVYKTWEKGFEAADIKAGGFPRKRHFQVVSGRDAQGTVIWEREWESVSAMDAAYAKYAGIPEVQELFKRGRSVIEHEFCEIIYPVSILD